MPFFTKSTTGSSAADARQAKLAEAGLDQTKMTSTSSLSSDATSPPPYTEADSSAPTGDSAFSASFAPTTHLQIQATGVSSCSSLCSQDPVPIPVFRVQPGSPSFAVDSAAPDYLSIRTKRKSNSCALVRGSDPKSTPVNATIYRWGPGRHPRMRFISPHSSASVEEAIGSDDVEHEEVEVRSRSIISRDQKIATPFGTFQWRYGSRSERKETLKANSLLILEKIDNNTSVCIAHFVRNDEFRTPGTNKHMAGNGGRLMIDLSMWKLDKGAIADKVEAFVVASCICMLKKEMDRMRDNTVAVIV